MDKVIHYGRNPGFNIPTKRLPRALIRDLSAFVESESTDREARAMELAELYGVSVHEILKELDKIRYQ